MNLKINLLSACFIFMSFNVFAQLTIEDLPTAAQYQNIKKQEVSVVLHTNEKQKGVLYNVTAESVILLPMDDYIDRYSHFVKLVKEDQKIFKTSSILKVQEKKRNAGKGFLIGLGIGGIIGYKGSSPGWEGLGAGLTGAAGGLVGAIIGGLIKQSYKPKDKAKMEKLKKKAIMYGY